MSTSDVVGMAKARIKLDCGLDQLYDLIKAGELDSYLEGNRRKITIESIERLIEKRLAADSGEFRRHEHMRVLRAKHRRRGRAGAPERDTAA
jgi:hypothetical protein